jgi:hypothetical protein
MVQAELPTNPERRGPTLTVELVEQGSGGCVKLHARLKEAVLQQVQDLLNCISRDLILRTVPH